MRPSRTHAAAACAALSLAVACGGTEPSNIPPVAAFTATCTELACRFENASTDGDGSIAAHAWDFGDGGTSSDRNPTHAYVAPGGEFTVTVAVTDDDGAATTATRQVIVQQGDDSLPEDNDSLPGSGNTAPLAVFSVTCEDLTCSFTNLSADPDPGDSVVAQLWSFGDSRSSAETHPSHVYDPPGGEFSVTLTVTDSRGASGRITQSLIATPTPTPTPAPTPDRSGTYERLTPHAAPGLRSRYAIHSDNTFDYVEEGGNGQRRLSGRWAFATNWGGWEVEPGGTILLDFDEFAPTEFCGEALGFFRLDGYLGISLCLGPINGGVEEGVYSSLPNPEPPNVPPPLFGQIAFVRNGRIHRINTDGTGLTQLSPGPTDVEPAWSPDGGRIAFSRHGEAPGIYIMTADGRNLVRRTSEGSSPSWSPDGRWVGFSCQAGGVAAICKIPADDDGTEPVTVFSQQGVVDHPEWSPDGTRFAFTSDWAMWDFWFDIWLVSADGSQPVVLREHTPANPNPDAQWTPTWSPDGTRIAFVECPWSSYFCSSGVMAVMNADGSGLVRLAAAGSFPSPTWSPDGQTIAFAFGGAIEWVSADGRQRGRIVANGLHPAWRP